MSVCLMCKASMHASCQRVFSGMLEEGDDCCCGGSYDLHDELVGLQVEETRRRNPPRSSDEDDLPAFGGNDQGIEAPKRQKGDSGYIHPDAWVGTYDIGTLNDVESTGRKRVARMYPIPGGRVCDWAGMKNCGGGVKPIVGCHNNPASDLHHGPDKNTLNNAKASYGIGDSENVHIICSECHNAWHSANDAAYPDYNRTEQQAEPWLPEGMFGQHDPIPAEYDELERENRRRHEQAKRRGRKHRGRNAAKRVEGDLSLDDE